MSKPHISFEKRARICLLIEQGSSTRQVAELEGISHSSVARIIRRRRETGSLNNKPKSGRPRILQRHDERKAIRLLKSNKCQTAIDVQRKLFVDYNKKVSADTIRRIFKRNGLQSRVLKKKPFLKKSSKQKRLIFARKYKDWTIENWRHVIWSDESKFSIFGSDGRKYYWKEAHEPIRDSHVIPTMKFGGGSIMVWGCFSSDGIGYLCRINGRMDSKLYEKILKEDFLGTLSWYKTKKDDITFQHDNDPKHTAKRIQKWLKQNKIKVLYWPPQSPDLNPIEHLWSEAKRRLYKQPKSTSQEDLWQKLQDIWNNIESETCLKLIDSMLERIRDVIKAKGSYTRW